MTSFILRSIGTDVDEDAGTIGRGDEVNVKVAICDRRDVKRLNTG